MIFEVDLRPTITSSVIFYWTKFKIKAWTAYSCHFALVFRPLVGNPFFLIQSIEEENNLCF
jgi:hypothetical protein